MNKTRSWFDWVTGGGRRAEGSDEAREQRVADTASDIAASSRGARRELSDAASRTGSAIGDMANAASDTVQRTASESMNVTKSKSNQMKDDMDENYQEARERSRSIAGQAVDSVNDTFNATEERVSNVGHAMADHTQQAADTMDSMLRRTPEELQQARAGDQTAVESRELAREANNPERGGIHRTPRRAGMDPYNEPKWMRKTGVNFSHNSEHRWID
jgi:DNA anti-recombination protein RmuC